MTNAFLGALEELKKSLLHQAFNGELWAPGLGFLKLAPIVEPPCTNRAEVRAVLREHFLALAAEFKLD